MGTAWVLAAMVAALAAFLFARPRTAQPRHDPADERGYDRDEGLAPGSVDASDDTRPSVVDPTRREFNSHSGATP